MKNSPAIAILGAGSWGTALALYFARQGQQVFLWHRDADQIVAMQKSKHNPFYLSEYIFPDNLHPVADLKEILTQTDDILIAVPSIGFRETLERVKPLLQKNHRIVWATKGLDQTSGELLHIVAQQILGTAIPLSVLSGPSYAKEVAMGLPTAVVIASHHKNFANELVARFNSAIFRMYYSNDVIGVEVGGAVKNVLAIAIGISDGMGFGTNARSALITRGLSEMIRLGLALGAKVETFIGLSGIGDLVLTCTDNQSRNRRFGLALGQGKSPDQAQQEIHEVVEGRRNAKAVIELAQKYKVEMPIAKSVLDILEEKITLKEALHNLLSREPKIE